MSKSPTSNQASSASLSAATLWLLDGDQADDARLAAFAQLLGADERCRLERFLRPQRAREFLMGRLLLRHAARQLLGSAASHIDVIERAGQAPAVSFPAFAVLPDFHFSISHSHGDIACLASTACAVGVDIESKTHARDAEALSAAAFDDALRQWLAGLDVRRRDDGFHRAWNNREAIHKLRSNLADLGDAVDPPACGTGWNCFRVDHPYLHIGVCTAQELSAFEVIRLPDLHPAP